ncbi:ROK family protein [Caproiciproducens sp.]
MDYTAVVDIGGTNIKYGLIDPGTDKIITSAEVPTDAAAGGPAVIKKVIALLDSMQGYCRIGISTCGQVDNRTGSILFATDNLPNYSGMKVKEIIEKEYVLPVSVENDVNAAALGEAHFGAAKGLRNFLCLTYGTGIGGAIIIDGELYIGTHGSAGEFGHFVSHKNGLPCTCGQCGCYESYASTGALVRSVEQQLGCNMDGRQIFCELREGNPSIKKIIDLWIDEIASGLAGLTQIFDPQGIVLGGGIMKEPYVIEQLRALLPSLIMPSYRGIKLLPAQLGNTAGLMGAYYAVHHMEGIRTVK